MSGGAVLILGAGSSIAKAIAHRFAEAGHALVLAGRSAEELERDVADVRLRFGVGAAARHFEATDYASHADFVAGCIADAEAIGSNGKQLEGVVLCHGYIAPEEPAKDFDLIRRTIETNYTSAVSVLHPLADYFERRKAGFVCAVSSIAGDRGRQSNYIYGSSKAALSTLLSGLRNRLSRSGVPVTTVKPGFVDTALTFGNDKMFLVAKPDRVARDVFRSVRKGRDVVYTPWFWRWIMLIVKSVPEPVFKRMKM